MKKLFINVLALSFLVNSAFAQENSKNNHVVSLELTRLDVDQEFGRVTYLGSDDAFLPTIGYGYKIDLGNKIFVKPSITYTFGDIEIKDTDGTNDSSTFTPHFSAELDFGYEIVEKFSLFATIGLFTASFERQELGFIGEATDSGFLYGFGGKYDINEKFSVSAKYQKSQIDFGVEGISNDFEVENQMIKIGVGYNF